MIDNLCRLSSPPAFTPIVPVPGFMPAEPTLQEVFTATGDVSAIGLALSQIKRGERSQLLWVQDGQAIREMGRVFLHGLPFGFRQNIVHIAAKNACEALWAMAEGLKCGALGAVIGEIHGNPRMLDFTATRRLAVAAERYGVPAFLVRVNGHADLSAARRRWRVESRPSLPHPHDENAPGAPVWSLDLFRARDMLPQRLEVSYDRTEHRTQNRLDLVSADGAGSLAADQRQAG